MVSITNDVTGVVAIDDGGFSTGVVKKDGFQECFPSVKGLYGERNLTEPKHKYDFIVEYKNQKYVMGKLAMDDCKMPLEMHTETKQNEFYDLSILVALHQYGYASNNIVTSVPIRMYNDEERDGRVQRLKKSHTITVNGVTKTFLIADVKIAPETASAFWINKPVGKTRYIDFGSRTIGYASTINEDGIIRFLDSESDTFFGKGIAALRKNYNPKALADFVCGRLLVDWDKYDKVYLLGGGALDTQLATYVKEYFPNAEVMTDPKMCNALGMYNIGRAAYGMA